MSKFTNPLDNIRVASPCSQDWEAMNGDERKRFCGSCQLNVYNLSGMTKEEAERLILSAEGRLCVRFFRRTDGTVLTKDCPVGWAALKKRVSKFAAAAAALIIGVMGGLGGNFFLKGQGKEVLMGEIAPVSSPAPSVNVEVEQKSQLEMGEISSTERNKQQCGDGKTDCAEENSKIIADGKKLLCPLKEERKDFK